MSFRTLLPLVAVVLGSSAFACSSESSTGTNPSGTPDGAGTCTESAECGDGKVCDAATKLCVAPSGTEIGSGDGSPASVTFTEIYTATKKA
ncbi:MAG: hypothetical protein K0S65_1567, partial [Labilithrix sp.]|nr:hypothetical protein [Labilithrix sp.]